MTNSPYCSQANYGFSQARSSDGEVIRNPSGLKMTKFRHSLRKRR
nr:MAG TPA: hypothetical protein [Caudoviricetes sp.]